MTRRVLGFGLLLLAGLAACGFSESTARWRDGSLTMAWNAGAPSLKLHIDGASTVQLSASRHERLGLSAFQSSGPDTAWRSELAAPGWTATLLSLAQQDGAQRPIAAILRPGQRAGGTLVLWCGASQTTALEHLYAFLLRSSVEHSFELKDSCSVLGDPDGAVAAAKGADLLKRIAQLRGERSGASSTNGRQWRVTEVLPQLDGNEPLSGVALVKAADAPVVGASVTFAREPHLACTATTDGEGMARCTMYDTHGHAPHDAGAVQQPTVVTFAGRMGADFVDVPVVAVVETPRPTRCLSTVVPANVAANWSASCRGFASRTWGWP